MDKTKKVLILSLMPLFLTLIFILYIVVPTVQKITVVNKELKQATTAYAESKSKLDNYRNDKKLCQNVQELKEKLGDFDIKVPAEDDLSILLIDLGKFAETLNVKVLSLSSNPEVEKEIVDPKKKNKSSSSRKKKTAKSPLYAVPLEISALGYYPDILNFVGTLEKYERTLVINDMKIENFKDDKDIADPRVQMTIDCEVYKFNSQQSDTEKTSKTENTSDKN